MATYKRHYLKGSIMYALQALSVISLYVLIIIAVMALIALVCEATKQDVATSDAVNALRFSGVLYIGKNDRPLDCYRHIETGAIYYKIGLQFRNANNGRIVATTAALNGTY